MYPNTPADQIADEHVRFLVGECRQFNDRSVRPFLLSLAVPSQKYPHAPPSVGRESDTPGAAYLSIRCDTDDLQLRVNTEDSITRMTVL